MRRKNQSKKLELSFILIFWLCSCSISSILAKTSNHFSPGNFAYWRNQNGKSSKSLPNILKGIIHGKRSGHSINQRVPFVLPKPLSYPDFDDHASILEETKNFLNQKHSPFDLLSLGLGTTFQDRLDFLPPTTSIHEENKNLKIQNSNLKSKPSSNSNPYFTEPPQHILHPLGVIRDFGFLQNDPNDDIFTKQMTGSKQTADFLLNRNYDQPPPLKEDNLDFLKLNDPMDFTNFQQLESNLNEEDQKFLTNHYKEGLAIKEELENLLGQRFSFFDDSPPPTKGLENLKNMDNSFIGDIPATTTTMKESKHFVSRPNYSIRF